MTDVSGLEGLAAKIASGKYPNIAAYANAQADATVAQEKQIRLLAEEVAVLKAKAGGGTDPGGTVVIAPPPLTFGASLPARLPESTGSVVTVNSTATLNAALAIAVPGRIIEMQTASYQGIYITQVGSAAAPITLRAAAGHTPKFVASATQGYPVRIEPSARYIRIRGLEFTDPAGQSVVHLYFKGKDCELDGCYIHGSGTAFWSGTLSGVSGIYSDAASERLQVWNTRFTDIGVRENADHGWYMEGISHVLANSVLYSIPIGYPVHVYPTASNCIVTNNTIVNNPWKSGIIVGGTAVNSCLFVNNIVAFSNTSDWAVRGYGVGTNNVLRHSLLWSPTIVYTAEGGLTVTTATMKTVNPLFVNNASDWRLQATSPAKGMGDINYCPRYDIAGLERTAAHIGAYNHI